MPRQAELFYTADQPREPAGSSEGGRFAKVGVAAFHGTTEEVIENIRREGITVQPRGKHTFEEGLYAGPRGQSVYVTTSRESAENWAWERFYGEDDYKTPNRGSPVVLELSIPREAWQEFKRDEAFPTGEPTAFRRERAIKPEWIVGAYEIKVAGGRTVQHRRIFTATGNVTVFAVIVIDNESETFAYDESQHPRDERGRWTNAEGGSEGQGRDRVWLDNRLGRETVGEWLDRHKIEREGDGYVFYHGTPKEGGATDSLRSGSYLAETEKEARYYAARDRGLKPDEVVVYRLVLKPDEIEPGSFPTVRGDLSLKGREKFAAAAPKGRDIMFVGPGNELTPGLAFPDLNKELAAILEGAMRDAIDEHGLDDLVENTEVAAEAARDYAARRAAELVTDIEETTRERMNAIIEDAVEKGLSPAELADNIGKAFAFSDQRADLIARTETANAWNAGVVEALREAGEEYVFVTDGDYDEACQNADGEIWTLEEAEANLIEHPNCERQFRPLTGDEVAEQAAEDEFDEEEGFGSLVGTFGILVRNERGEWDEAKHPRDEKGRWTEAGGYVGEVPRGGFKPSVAHLAFTFESQRRQYAPKGPAGLSYVENEVGGGKFKVNTLLYRDKAGRVIGILNHYPQDVVGGHAGGIYGRMRILLERKGAINVMVDPKQQGKGIGSTLLREAGKRWNIDLAAQDYTEAGAALANKVAGRRQRGDPFRDRTPGERLLRPRRRRFGVEQFYAEDQPRDEHNQKWVKADGGAASDKFTGNIRADFDEAFAADGDTLLNETLKHYDAEPVKVMGKAVDDLYEAGDYVIDIGRNRVEEKGEWLFEADASDYFPEFEDEWNRDFWESPSALYHATTEDHVEGIEKNGIVPMNETRGLSNRGVWAAVFTSSEMDDLLDGAYGDVLYEIDTAAMKRDGVKPYVQREPDVVENDLRGALASAINFEWEGGDTESGISPWTVIVNGRIPAKYLTRVDKKKFSANAEWDESKHPRDENNQKWVEVGGEGSQPWQQTRDEYVGEFKHVEGESDDARFARLRESMNREKEWQQSALAAVSLGRLSPEEAEKRGLYARQDWKPLPPVLYHVTTAADAVENDGLKSRFELHQESGHGLGGGDDTSISFTESRETAEAIRDAFYEAHDVATGKLTVAQMYEDAKNGVGAKGPYDELAVKINYANSYRHGDPPPADLEALMRGVELNWNLYGGGGALRPPKGEGWVRSTVHEGAWERPLSPESLRDRAFTFYKGMAAGREYAGGRMDPLFFTSDIKALAAMDPKRDVAVMKFRPTQGARGYRMSALGEWRTHSGKAVWLAERHA